MSHQAGPPSGMVAAPNAAAGRYRARWRALDSLADDDWRQWASLARGAVDGNPYLAPWFVRPALRYLEPRARLELLWVDRGAPAGAPTLAGLLLVRTAAARRSLPRGHLEAWRGLHAYTGGALFAPDGGREALHAMLAGLAVHPGGYGALRITNLRSDGDGPLLVTPGEVTPAMQWFATRSGSRAALRLRAAAAASDSGPRDVRRARARLVRRFGRLDLRVLRGPALTDDAIERHLALEASGWKSASNSALLSSPATAEFFRELAAGAREVDAAVFCELWAGETLVASTSNFLSGDVLSAFKLGWEPRAARCSPGLLVDHALAEVAASALPEVATIDSCADPGSHLERLWPDRITVTDGYLAWGRAERATLGVLAAARRMRRLVRGVIRG